MINRNQIKQKIRVEKINCTFLFQSATHIYHCFTLTTENSSTQQLLSTCYAVQNRKQIPY